METRIQHIFLAGVLFSLFGINIVAAQQPVVAPSPDAIVDRTTKAPEKASKLVEPRIKRRQIDVADVEADDVEIGAFYGLISVEDFGVNSLAGASIAYHVTEDLFIQGTFGTTDTQPTSFELLSGARLLTDEQRKYRYYDLNLGYNLLPGEAYIGDKWAFNTAFYVVMGIGSTDFAGDNRFTVTWGGGYRMVAHDWLAFNLELRDHLFDSDLLGVNKTTHNISLQAGFTIFF